MDVNLPLQQEIREFQTQNLQLQQENREFNFQNTQMQEQLESEKEKSFNQNQTTLKSGDKHKKIHQVLLSAYPSKDKLNMMVYYELGHNLNTISESSNLEEVIFNLIITAEAEGWLEDLIRAASNSNPGNLDLRVIAEEFR